MQTHKVSFPNADGNQLSGLLDLPAGPPRAYALFAHCFTCSKNLKAATHIARAMAAAGIGVLRFDFTGLGQSEGEFADTSFSSNVADLKAAVDWLSSEYAAPSILFGHSLGGTAVLQAAGDIPSAVAVATIGSPAEPEHVEHLIGDQRETLEAEGEAEVSLGGRRFRLKKQFLADLGEHDLQQSVGRLRKALLILHAPLDEIVGIDNASRLFAAAKHPKSFISLDAADHLLSREADSRYAGSVLAAWASRYLPDTPAADALSANEGEVVARTGADSFLTSLAAGEHHLLADEPAGVGGSNAGPSPYDLLAAALAACTTMTLGMYARHKKLDGFESATVRVEHGRVHAEDCVDCVQKDGKIHEFRRELSIAGDLDDAQRERMLEIADRCPVHRTLHNEIKVRTVLADR